MYVDAASKSIALLAITAWYSDDPKMEVLYVAGLSPYITCIAQKHRPYLVGGLEHLLFSHILGIIIPVD